MEHEESDEHIIGASFLGILSALALHFRHRKSKNSSKDDHVNNFLAPVLDRPESGRVGRVERFSIYVVRQMGFKEGEECHQLRELAQEYLKRSKGCKERIFEYFGDDEAGLGEKLVEELDTLIFSYFAFHWSQVPLMICQVLSVDVDQKKFKDAVMAATRKLRFEKITKDLKVTRMFSTLVEEMNIIRTVSNSDSKCTDVMVPVAHSDRSPVILLMGGGMGAGKSTVLKQILKESFWSGAAKNAVVVEADGFKETDVIYRALSSRGHHQDMLQIAELVHQSSTDAASSLLVTALNEGRDVIMDGTLSWKPFVEQTIAMARDVHRCRYRMGEGYKVAEDGTVIEKYWEEVEEEDEQEEGNYKIKRPYRIELVGVVCDAYLAVVRGIRRAIATGRAVRVKSQLKSHKRFASAFRSYCELVDNAKLYCTNDVNGPAKLIAWKDGENNLLVDQEEIRWLDSVKSLNDEAESIYELYPDPETICRPGSIWADRIMSSKWSGLQDELRDIIRKIENPVQNVNISN